MRRAWGSGPSYLFLLVVFFYKYNEEYAQPVSLYSTSASCSDDVQNKVMSLNDIDYLYDKFTKRFTGKLTFIGEYPPGITSCQLDPLSPIQRSSDWIPVAVGPKDYRQSLLCGTCMKISPSTHVKRTDVLSKVPLSRSYNATVVDVCPHCNLGDIRMYKDMEETQEGYDVIYEAVDCPDIVGDKGFIKVKMEKCNEKRTSIQVKNAKIPTTLLEIYDNGSWKCLKRTNNNFFILESDKIYKYPLEMRTTAITGQSVGFAAPPFNNNIEFFIPGQYSSFETVSIDNPPKSNCYLPMNSTVSNFASVDEPDEVTRSHDTTTTVPTESPNGLKPADRHSKGNKTQSSSNEILTIDELARALGKIGNATEETWLKSIPLSAKLEIPLCSNKSDGRYELKDDCKSFVSCVKGAPIIEQCERGLLFNADQSTCDVPTNSSCIRGIDKTGDIYDTYSQQGNDDEVYTKRFTK